MANGPTVYRTLPPPRATDCGIATGNVDQTMSFNSHATGADAFMERARYLWSAGDYDRIAAGFRPEAVAFVRRLGLGRSMRVLDAACGSGNVAIPAAHTGAEVRGCDIVPELLDAAAAWASRESLSIRFDHATVERMPYADASFDVVTSMFGVMFAARPGCVMKELARVVRPGGRVAVASWTPGSFAGRMLAAHTACLPPAPLMPSPLLWGDEAVIRERFDSGTWQLAIARRTLLLRYPFTPAGTVELFRASFGPTVRTLEMLDEDRRAGLARELLDLWTAHHRGGAKTTVESDYLEVIATRV